MIDMYLAFINFFGNLGIVLGAGFLVGLLLFIIIYPIVFWVQMLIDCINRDFNDRPIWILVIFFGSLLGAILYYYCVKNKKIS
jgi:hypothetical protein